MTLGGGSMGSKARGYRVSFGNSQKHLPGLSENKDEKDREALRWI